MQRSWCRPLAAFACLLATASGPQAATSVSIESAAPGSAGPARPAVVLVRNLEVPAAGAAVTVTASARGLEAPVRLATVFVLGGRDTGATRTQSFRSIVNVPPSVLAALERDPHATISLTVTPRGHSAAATRAGPYPLTFVRRPEPG